MVLVNETCDNANVIIVKTACKNLCVRLADVVTATSCDDVPNGKRVHILPLDDTIESVTGNFFKVCLKPYFLEAYRMVKKGTMAPTTNENNKKPNLYYYKATGGNMIWSVLVASSVEWQNVCAAGFLPMAKE